MIGQLQWRLLLNSNFFFIQWDCAHSVRAYEELFSFSFYCEYMRKCSIPCRYRREIIDFNDHGHGHNYSYPTTFICTNIEQCYVLQKWMHRYFWMWKEKKRKKKFFLLNLIEIFHCVLHNVHMHTTNRFYEHTRMKKIIYFHEKGLNYISCMSAQQFNYFGIAPCFLIKKNFFFACVCVWKWESAYTGINFHLAWISLFYCGIFPSKESCIRK